MRQRILFAIGLLGFHLLFWHEGIGINWILFTFIAIVAVREPKAPTQRELLYAAPFLLAAIGLILFHTTFSMIALVMTFTTYLGYIANQQTSVVENFINSLVSFALQKRISLGTQIEAKASRSWQRSLAISVLPLVIFALFYVLFLAGNPVFKDFSDRAFAKLGNIFSDLNFYWIFFLILGALIINWILRDKRDEHLQMDTSAPLKRIRKRKSQFTQTLALKNEYRSAVLLFAMLNALFLVVNFIDVKWVWFQFQVEDNFNLKEFVHEGVGWLIFTTLLSAAILLIYFRRNLNFFPNNQRLILLARIWVLQNIILAVSVAIRTFHYINFHGLAPKRIGVLVFVLFILTSFIAVGIKIHKTYQTGWVVKWVSGVSLALIGFCAVVPWNHWIANYNLNHNVPNEVDVDYYLSLGPEVYPILYANMDVIEDQINAHQANEVKWVHFTDVDSFRYSLDSMRDEFLETYGEFSSASWSFYRHNAYMSLKNSSSSLAMNE